MGNFDVSVVTEGKRDLSELQICSMVILCFSSYCPLVLIIYFEGSVQLQLKSIAIILESQGTAMHAVSEPRVAMDRV